MMITANSESQADPQSSRFILDTKAASELKPGDEVLVDALDTRPMEVIEVSPNELKLN